MTINDNIKRLYEENKRNPLAWVLVALGVLMLTGALWPLFIIAPGAVFIYAAYDRERCCSGLIFPGLIIAGTGTILLYQNITGHWESWAYAWTLYPVFVGLGLQFNGQRAGRKHEIATGSHMVRYGLMAFAGLALFFELLIFGSVSAWILLAAGLALLWWNGHIKIGDDQQDEAYRQKVRAFVEEKRKHVQMAADDLDKSKAQNGTAAVDPDLRERIQIVINEAKDLAETPETEDDPDPVSE